MKVIISGQAFDPDVVINQSTLLDIFELKVKTGVGFLEMQRDIFGKTQVELLEDPAALRAMVAFVWLCKRSVGEHLTFEEAGAVPLTDIDYEGDDEPEDVAPDPLPARPAGEAGAEAGSKRKPSKKTG